MPNSRDQGTDAAQPSGSAASTDRFQLGLRISDEVLVAITSDTSLQLRDWRRQRIQSVRRVLAQRRPREGSTWQPEEDRLLGSDSDSALAKRLGRSARAVTARRQALRVRLTPVWTAEEDKMLGTRTDRQVALLLGRRTAHVERRRRDLAIACNYERRPWLESELALLGALSDEEVVKLTGHGIRSVVMKREELGRHKADSLKDFWTPEEDALLGTMADWEVAARTGRNVGSTRRRRTRLGIPNHCSLHRYWTAEETALLGKLPGKEVGKFIDREPAVVALKRRTLGIPPADNPNYHPWSPAEIEILRKPPARQAAEQLGLSLSSVLAARWRYGIA